MKKIAIIILMMMSIRASAQKVELGLQLNSGLFSFQGESAKNDETVRYQNTTSAYNWGHSLGAKKDLNLGLAGNVKWISKSKVFFASELGFEYAKSRINVHTAYSDNLPFPVIGKINLRVLNIYTAPTVGYRFVINENTKIDLGFGLDISGLLHADSKMKIKNDEAGLVQRFKKQENFESRFDLRPHANLKIAYHQFGIFCGYSHGTTNYLKGMVGGGPWYATSRLWRMGISYQLK